MSDLTNSLYLVYREQQAKAHDALVEVLSSAYKDATGTYPSDKLRDDLYEAVRAEK